ncbi:MAG: hypothetical protein AB7G75_00365 [Candidatus Binatia bacterium]
MKYLSSTNFRQWLLASAFTLSTIVTVNTPGFAQIIPGEPDHLKCYEVLKDQNQLDSKEVDLVNKFGLEPDCDVTTKARLFCTPVRKFIEGGNGNDPRGAALSTDFTCYNVQCPPNPSRRLEIDDQFGHRDIGIKNARMLCTPTLSAPLPD